MGLRSDIFADYEAFVKGRRKASWLLVLRQYLTAPGFRVAVLYRLGRAAQLKGHRFRAFCMERKMNRIGVDISTSAQIGPGLRIPHPLAIVIGSKTRIGKNAYILQCVTLGGSAGKARPDGSTQPHVGDDVLIGAGAKVLGPVDVGNGVIIGANAVALEAIPDGAIAVGIPARVVKIQSPKGAEAAESQ